MISVLVAENDGYFSLQAMHSNSSDREQIESYISSSIKNTFTRVSVIKLLDARSTMPRLYPFKNGANSVSNVPKLTHNIMEGMVRLILSIYRCHLPSIDQTEIASTIWHCLLRRQRSLWKRSLPSLRQYYLRGIHKPLRFLHPLFTSFMGTSW